MKRLFITLAVASVAASGYAQDAQQAVVDAAVALAAAPKVETPVEKPKYWTKSLGLSLGADQTALFNWSAGGYNSITLAAGLDAKANYAKDLMVWNNRLQLDYSFFWSADKKNVLQTKKDRIYLESRWAYKTSEKSHWSYSAGLDFKTQFANNYDNYKLIEGSEDEYAGTLKSGFLSPANIDVSLGMAWDPCKWLDVELSPLTGGVVIVTEESLRGNYGMKLNEDGLYNSSLFQLGAKLKVNGKWTINDALFIETQLVVFTDYLDHPFVYNRVNWDNKIVWKAAKFFSVGLSTWLIYDPIVKIDDVTSKVQFKEFLSLSFAYVFADKKKK